jgi:glycosyltransferase involved in cell wall biosynthesis
LIKNIKICFFPGALNLGGVGKLTINLAKEMVERGYTVHFFLTKTGGDYMDEIPEGVQVFNGSKGALRSIIPFIKYLRAEQPTAVISARDYLNYVNIICTGIFSRSSKIITSVHVDYSGMPIEESWGSRVLNFFGRVLYPKADKIVAVSKGVAVDFASRFRRPIDEIDVIYNPTYVPEKYVISSAIKNEKFFHEDKDVIIAVGRMKEQKNFTLLIKAFIEVYAQRPCRLVILGEGDQRAQLEKLVSAAGLVDEVYMPGYVENPIDYIRRSDLFVMSSSWEGFGNVIVEALGVGIKIVSTDCPSGPAEILENGKYGILVPINSVSNMKDAILKALAMQESPERLIARAHDFSVERITTQYLKLL